MLFYNSKSTPINLYNHKLTYQIYNSKSRILNPNKRESQIWGDRKIEKLALLAYSEPVSGSLKIREF